MYEPRGHIIEDAAQIKSVVGVPVIAVGSITPAMGEEVPDHPAPTDKSNV